MSDALVNVPALTLLNPWAELVAHHGKDVENRTWMPHEGVCRLLIHAGKRWDVQARADHAALLVGEGVAASAIVAVADLAFACDASYGSRRVVCGCGKWAQPGQCHWNLANVRALPEPVPASGRQGLWRPASDVVQAVAAQLRAVGS